MAKIIAAVITLLTALVWYATSQALNSDTVPSSPGYETTVDSGGGCDCTGTGDAGSGDYYGQP